MWNFCAFLAIVLCLRDIEAQDLKGVTVMNRPYVELGKNGKIQGFTVDLIRKIAEIGNFSYSLELTPDGQYGRVVNNTINGMIGEVHSNRADFAIADIGVTDVRREYVDFTEPFMEAGVVILIHKNNVNNIKSLRDLAEQTDIPYGAILYGSTYYMFSQTTDPVLSKLYRQMTNNPGNLVRHTREGLERVKTSPYAFIVEKPFAEYITGINCDLTFIDDNNSYFPRQFAIALNKNSNYTHQFNTAIRQLKDSGSIDRLKSRYWKKCGVVNGVTIENKPFIELNGGKLDGFAMDLMKEITKLNKLNFTMDIAPDKRYGVPSKGNINGMLGEVFNERADFAIQDITVTEKRKQFVDFTEPFIETELVIIMSKNNSGGINSFQDLADQTAIQYGMMANGSTNAFFAFSNDSTIQKMYRNIQANPHNYVNKLGLGVKRAKAFPFALITERSFAEYITGKDCNLTYVVDENKYYPQQYAIALAKNSTYLDGFNSAIRELRENGMITLMKNRYWKKCGVLSGVTIKGGHLAQLMFGKLEGFVMDLMNEISSIANFNYSLYFTPDNRYGHIKNNKINGMLGEVFDKRADFAVADITVTDVRKEFVDFTEPFIETRIVVLIHKNNVNGINTFRDLAQQTAIKYGPITNGTTSFLFQNSTDPTLQAMFRQMTANPEVFVSNGAEGIQKVKSTPFALFVEKAFADTVVGRECDLTYIEDHEHIQPRQFAIALPKNSPHLEKFNMAIRTLKSNGRVESLMNRYRKECGVLKGVTTRPYAELSRITGKMTGFAVDLMNEIALIIGQNYTLDFQADNIYGRVRNNSVDGMIGEVYRQLVDFAIADLTVTEPRKQFVEFTEPFAETGLVILIHRDNANNITSFSDLSQQTDIKYGIFNRGSTYHRFAQSSDPVIAQMFSLMSDTDGFVANNREGIERVNSTRFAFVLERSTAEYITGMDCNLTFITDPDRLFPSQYAIALPKGSAHIQAFNSAITELKGNGVIDRLRSKYWKTCAE